MEKEAPKSRGFARVYRAARGKLFAINCTCHKIMTPCVSYVVPVILYQTRTCGTCSGVPRGTTRVYCLPCLVAKLHRWMYSISVIGGTPQQCTRASTTLHRRGYDVPRITADTPRPTPDLQKASTDIPQTLTACRGDHKNVVEAHGTSHAIFLYNLHDTVNGNLNGNLNGNRNGRSTAKPI